MSLSKILARKANASENKVDVESKNVISESSSDIEYSSSSEVHAAFNEITNFEEENEIPTYAVRMLNLGKEFIIFCLIMITYAALTKDPPKVSKPPAAYPFFSEGSVITDWYKGEISAAIEHARFSDITFIMYYAPWDAESQAARQEFEEAAKFMKNQVTFAAVNCWHPSSECRHQYSKVYKWPVFIAYPSLGRGIQYNGPTSAVHFIRFLLRVCYPVIRLNSERPIDFDDVYVVATLNTLPGTTNFIIYYLAALKYLEKDPQHRISFFVNTSSNPEPQLIFYLWNETLTYPINDKPWASEEILHWLYKNLHQVSSWVLPNSAKSITLSNSIDDEPALILFTPRNPLHPISDYYSLLQEIGQQYYNCDDVKLNPQSIGVQMKRSANLLRYNNLVLNCKLKQKSRLNNCIWKVDNIWKNTSSTKHSNDCKLLSTKHSYDSSCTKFQENIDIPSCSVFKPTTQNCDDKTTNTEIYPTSILKGNKHHRSASNVLKAFQRNICRNFMMAEKYYPAVFETNIVTENDMEDINGLACKSNKTLSFLAMDSLLHFPFAEKFGINLTKYKHKTTAVIIDDKMESHYILEEPVTGHSLREFILKFTNNKLSRSFKSSTTVTEKSYLLLGKNKLENVSKVVVEELNTTSFLPSVMRKNKAVIVFFYTKQCSFCSGFSYILLSLARKLRFIEHIVVSRIDAEENILPWEYTMESYPTILFFPTQRKSESRVFQSNVPITVPNLLGFVLANIDPEIKIGAMWSLCLQMKQKAEATCYFSLLRETLAQIDRSLRDWRISNDRQKSKHLYKLRQLQQLHLLFANHPHNFHLITKTFEKLQVKFNFSDMMNVENNINIEL